MHPGQANWLHNGQGSGDTETGAYTLLGGTSTPSNDTTITRNTGAQWFLPSANEWYKAAHHQPAPQGGDSDDYWLYQTGSNSAPTIATANSVGDISNPGTNVANYERGADWNSLNGNLTTVGSAGTLSKSFYGTSDQGGNVSEWNETLVGLAWAPGDRVIRGGDWLGDSVNLWPSSGLNFGPSTLGTEYIGFRVATVPEPSSIALAAVALMGLVALGRRKRA